MLDATADFLTELGRSEDADQAYDALVAFSSGLGFDCGIAGELMPPSPGGTPEMLGVRLNANADEFEDYVARGLFRHDPLFASLLSAEKPYINDVSDLRSAPSTPEVRQLLGYEMIAAKVRLTFPPVAGTAGTLWAMSFGKRQPAPEARSLLREVSTTLWLAASAAALRMSELTTSGPEAANPLTPRERECLLRLAQGERVDRIADRLSLSNATVELHLANARRRLGARTSPEAVAKAVLKGWIAP
jgi:DNA-binding CsgD family transcriptional regulator